MTKTLIGGIWGGGIVERKEEKMYINVLFMRICKIEFGINLDLIYGA